MKKKSLNFKLITGGIMAVLLPVVIIGLFSVTKASKALRSLSEEQVVNLAKDLADMTQLVLLEELKQVKQLSAADLTIKTMAAIVKKGGDEASVDIDLFVAMLARIMKSSGKDYESILITDTQGKIIADGSEGKYIGVSLADRTYFQAAVEGQANISTPITSKLTGKPIAPVCAPIYSADGSFLGTVTNVLKMDFISEKIISVTVGSTGYPFMVDRNGLVISHPVEKHLLKTNLAKLDGMKAFMQEMITGHTGVGAYTFEGIDKIAGYAPVPLTGWSVGVTQPVDEFLAAAHSIRNVIMLVGCLFLAATVGFVLLFVRSISLPISRVIDGLNDGAEQVTSASVQISSAGQSLAAGASEQAAAIEETSSSLEEMSSMTKQNADNASMADSLMKETKGVVDLASSSMTELTASMDNIASSSEETFKIIKTIDEIAFQTNLLALNAAVEAARAGEAGAGFAVVADEVRSLAIRAADAAKNTASLIENTVGKVKSGSEIVGRSNEAFEKVTQNAYKVGELVAEIAAASNEQATGIEQINQAVSEMDKVVQQNAANAEESASAGEEMNAQAVEMKGMVAGLVELIKGQSNNGTSHQKSLPNDIKKSISFDKIAPNSLNKIALNSLDGFEDFGYSKVA